MSAFRFRFVPLAVISLWLSSLCVMTLLLTGTGIHAQTSQKTYFYVSPSGSDDSAGTHEAPWKTLQHASMNATPGSVVRIMAGEYAGFNIDGEGKAFSGTLPGGSEAVLSFVPYPGVLSYEILVNPVSSGTGECIAVRTRVDKVVIGNITLKGCPAGIKNAAGTNITMRNITMRNIAMSSGGATNTEVQNCRVYITPQQLVNCDGTPVETTPPAEPEPAEEPAEELEEETEEPEAPQPPQVCPQLPMLPIPAGGNVVRVSSSEQLRSALANAKPGDVIMLADGTYSGDFTLSKSGTASSPIQVRAENGGRAVFTNRLFTVSGDYGVVMGLTFDNGQVTVSGDNNRVTRNILKNGKTGGSSAKLNSAVLVEGSSNRVDHNEVANWHRRGLRVVPNKGIPRNNRIDHNYLHDFQGTGNAGDALQIGKGANHTFINTGTVMEYNLVERAEADGELLSVKSSGSTIRFNTFKDSDATVQIRHGTNNSLIGNTVINMKAMSVYGVGNQVIGNNLKDAPLIIRNGDSTQSQKGNGGTGHPAAENTYVAGNKVGTLIGVGTRIPGGSSSSGVPTKNTTLAGNQGKIQYGQHTGTKLLAGVPANIPQAVELTAADVGPAAPEDGVGGGAGAGGAGAACPAPSTNPRPASEVAAKGTTPLESRNLSKNSRPDVAGPSSRKECAALPIDFSNYEKGNLPAYARDNNLNTRWSTKGANQWIQFDLGAVTALDQVGIVWYRGTERTANFAVDVSADGSSWSRVYEGSSSGTTKDIETYGFDAPQSRYVRLVSYGNTDPAENDWFSITEVAFDQALAHTANSCARPGTGGVSGPSLPRPSGG